MTIGSVVTEDIDEPTTHAVVAAPVRGEARVEGQAPETVVRSIATELEQLGLEPDLPELRRRYHSGDTKVPQTLLDR